jgi:hypothetical protein
VLFLFSCCCRSSLVMLLFILCGARYFSSCMTLVLFLDHYCCCFSHVGVLAFLTWSCCLSHVNATAFFSQQRMKLWFSKLWIYKIVKIFIFSYFFMIFEV